ncbi:unnamed protein product [Brachionus calyciflorus]|uniref:Uncharacterized protein n=1 Tax=Brachionus calyciflorus TaxID=104777 RepID=A0A814C1I6_9BILA|nr:unnamed protein product [Brachionus calyciflorus]
MAENTPVIRRTVTENRPYIVELAESPTSQILVNSNRQLLPAIRDANPVNSDLRIGGLIDINNTQQKIKQLESRLQATEVSNRALIEDVILLQNDLAISLRRSLDTLNEEKSARLILENNYKFQNEAMLQLNGRLKRTEDLLQQDRNAMQSMIMYTRNLEQSLTNAQRDLFVRKEFQAKRLDELKIQIDEIQFSKERLELNANSLIEEIKILKNKVELEAINLNSIGGDLRNKTRRLEDETRQHMEVVRKQQDSMAITENNISALKIQLAHKIEEVKNLNTDVKNKIDSDREDRRLIEQQINSKLYELKSIIEDEKQRHIESTRSLESLKRELYQNLEIERNRINSIVSDVKESALASANDKTEKNKEEFNTKFREIERILQGETESLSKYYQNLKESTEHKIENFKRILEDEILNYRNETKTFSSKTTDSIKKLNEGLTLIELHNEESKRRFEKVINAEISSRKLAEKDIQDKLEGYNDKLTSSNKTLQTTINNLTSRLNEIKDQYVTRKDFESLEKKHVELQSESVQNNLKISTLKESLSNQTIIQEQNTSKLKKHGDLISQIENVRIPLLEDNIHKLPSKDDLANFKIETEEKISEEIVRIIKQNDIQHSEIKKMAEDRLDELNTQLSNFNNKLTQKINNTDKTVKDQIALQNEFQLKTMTTLKDETKKAIQNYDEKNKEDLETLEKKFLSSQQKNELLQITSKEEMMNNIENLKRDVNKKIDDQNLKLKDTKNDNEKELLQIKSKLEKCERNIESIINVSKYIQLKK